MSACATVELELQSKPECISLVRGMLTGVAEQLTFDGELLDDLKTAVSEACNNVVLHAYNGGPGPLIVGLDASPGAVEVVVKDWGEGIHQVAPSEDRMHVGVALISALADRAEFLTGPDGGTEVRMSFRWAARTGMENGTGKLETEPAWKERISGDVVVTLAPVGILGGVLGRLARAVAAGARFTLDRFSDVYLVTDAVAAHAAASGGTQITFALISEPRSLEITVGPFELGASRELQSDAAEPESLLMLLADELKVEPVDDRELVRVVVRDRAGTGAEDSN